MLPSLPLLPTIAALAAAIGIDLAALFHLIEGDHYITHTRRRRHGSRLIAEPLPDLWRVQRWILARILRQLPTHPAAHGYVPGRSTLTAVLPHCAAEVLVTTDLRSWFPSITRTQVEAAFSDLCGYPGVVVWALASLTTRAGSLPQGTCTSPTLSNLVAAPLDEAITHESALRGLTYTRYADDLILSGPRSAFPDHMSIARTLSTIEHHIEAQGWQMSGSKTRVMRRDRDRMIALGIVLNGEGPTLPREERRRLRAVLHAEATGEPISPHDAGRLAHARSVNRRPTSTGGPRESRTATAPPPRGPYARPVRPARQEEPPVRLQGRPRTTSRPGAYGSTDPGCPLRAVPRRRGTWRPLAPGLLPGLAEPFRFAAWTWLRPAPKLQVPDVDPIAELMAAATDWTATPESRDEARNALCRSPEGKRRFVAHVRAEVEREKTAPKKRKKPAKAKANPAKKGSER